jgi:hypothetical protein
MINPHGGAGRAVFTSGGLRTCADNNVDGNPIDGGLPTTLSKK